VEAVEVAVAQAMQVALVVQFELWKPARERDRAQEVVRRRRLAPACQKLEPRYPPIWVVDDEAWWAKACASLARARL
jgi:hypothetical protein